MKVVSSDISDLVQTFFGELFNIVEHIIIELLVSLYFSSLVKPNHLINVSKQLTILNFCRNIGKIEVVASFHYFPIDIVENPHDEGVVVNLSGGIIQIVLNIPLNSREGVRVYFYYVMELSNLLLHKVEGVSPDEWINHVSAAKEVAVLSQLQKASVPIYTPKAIIAVRRRAAAFI